MSIDISIKTKLILCLDKPSHLRTSDDLDAIYNCLKSIKAYSGLHPYLLQQMCAQVQYENLKERIVVYQGGKPEKNCYVVMSGSLIVVDRDRVPDILNRNYKLQESKIYPLITEGCAFGNNFGIAESDQSHCHPRPFSINLLDSKAVVTQDECELLYMDQKIFQEIWSKNEKFLRDLNLSRDISTMDTNCSALTIDGNNVAHANEEFNCQNLSVPIRISNRGSNTAILNAAFYVFKSSKPLLVSLPTKMGSKSSTSSQAMAGEDMVTWMRQLIKINSRLLAIGIWQVLLEDGILISITSPYCLRDSPNDYYAFVEDFSSNNSCGVRQGQNCDDLNTAVGYLMKLAPDSLFRMILHKPGKERTKDELEFVYGELLHIKSLSHLSSMVKRQLATLLMYEIHPHKDKILFNQGSEGTSWYIIVKGYVDVHINGKGVVCRLRENDDFGKLALVNNSPRAATIILRDHDCHFIKIDKDDFNRILRDVEVNTVRLTEHGKDVLLFERRSLDSPNRKISLINPSTSSSVSTYSVIAGTPEKLIDHLLENRIDLSKSYAAILDRVITIPDPMLETFFLTYFAFLTSHGLCSLLLVYFQNFIDQSPNDGRATPIEDKEHDHVILIRKTRIVHFLYWWCRISDGGFFEDHVILGFIENLLNIFSADRQSSTNAFNKEYLALNCLLEQFQKAEIASSKKIGQRSRFSKHQGNAKNTGPVTCQQLAEISPIKAKDLTKFLVHFPGSTHCMLRLPVESTTRQIIDTVSKHQNLPDDKLTLCEIKSDGEKIVFDYDDVGVMYSLSANGKIYLLNQDEFKEFTVIEPDLNSSLNPCKQDSNNILESTTIDELAFHLTFLDWQLFKNIHVYELLFKVLGRPKFGRITANLDSFIRQFTSIQYWVATEICQCQNAQKRVNVIKKMIKLASRLSELKNISSSFAVLMGLNNSSVARLQSTWERVTNKHKKLFHDLCSLLDPTRNHCAFRQYLKKTPPPIIPFVAIMLKDLTFINDANKTYFDDCMINFEKMQLFAATLHQFLHCRARPMIFENTTSMKKDKLSNTVDLQNFVRNLNNYDDQKVLTGLSMSLEAKQTMITTNNSTNNPTSVTFSLDN